MYVIYLKCTYAKAEAGLKGDTGGVRPPDFLQSLVFWNHLEELETALFEVALTI